MPKGIPKAGFRMTKNRKPVPFGSLADVIENFETDEEIDARLRERFDILRDLTVATVHGESRSLIVSGPPGLGKSYTVEQVLSELPDGQYSIERGFVRATGLYRLLYQHRLPGQVVVMDDADSVFFDDAALSLMKAACDTTENRTISWRAETKMQDEDGINLPTTFEFEGSMIFITNYDMDRMIDSQAKNHEHMAAMISRSHYVDLTLKSKRDYFIRINQVIYDGMLSDVLTQDQIIQVLDFIEDNIDTLRELSLRMAIKVANVMRAHPDKWERICRVTCCR